MELPTWRAGMEVVEKGVNGAAYIPYIVSGIHTSCFRDGAPLSGKR